MIYNELYNTKEIEKEWNSLKIPAKYHFFNLSDIFTNDISFYMSIRKDAGKTTNALILALILYKKYNVVSMYLRNDATQAAQGKVSQIFDTIIAFNYIGKLFKSKYNAVEYSKVDKVFHLINRDPDTGETVERDSDCFMIVRSNEKYSDYMSGNGRPRLWFTIWDEFLVSHQPHSNLVSEAYHNISTFMRDDPRSHAIALSNTVNKYDAVFDDLNIVKDIEPLDFGQSVSINTELGSRYFVHLLPVSAEKKSELSNKAIRFYGVNNAKFANFTGVEAWKGYNYKHLLRDDVNELYLFGFVHHRQKWLRIDFVEFNGTDAIPAFRISWSQPPRYEDTIIYTVSPERANEKLFASVPDIFKRAFKEDRIYYGTNEAGLLFDDFLRENNIRINRR